MPYYFGGLKIGIGVAAIGAIIAEFVAPTKGLGYMLLYAMSYTDMPLIFVIILITFSFGIGLFGLICLIEKFAAPWKEGEIT